MLAVAALTAAFALATADSGVPCALLTPTEVAEVLGRPVGKPAADPAQADDDTGGRRTSCTYRAGDRILVLSVVTFPTPEQARKALTSALVTSEMEGPVPATVVEEREVKEPAFWASTPEAASYVMLSDGKIVTVGLTGKVRQPASYHARLRKAAETAASRL